MPGPTVLVVDSAPQTAERAASALVGTGLVVRAARDAEEAEQALGADDVVAVLASVRFPRGNGYDLARQVRLRRPAAAVFLLCGGFDVYNADRAAEVGVNGRVNRPFSPEGLRGQIEAALGAFPSADLASIEGLEAITEVESTPAESATSAPRPVVEGLPGPVLQPPGSDERVATFLPRDWRSLPPVKVDPNVVAPAMEKAILAVLPEVVDAVLNKALATSPALREMLEVAVEQAVREALPLLARRVVLERLAELEAAAKEPTDG